MKDLLKAVATYGTMILLFYIFLVWIAVMKTPARHPDAYPQVPLSSGEYY